MALRAIKKLEITCDTCKKVIGTGITSQEVISVFETEAEFTEIYCTDCVKLPAESA